MNKNIGRFVISLDTELSWGSFDKCGISQHEAAFRNTREVIHDLCELFDYYEMPVTWALVMHLLEDCGDHHTFPNPQVKWVDWCDELPCASGVEKSLWYAPDILEVIEATGVAHEIALHGYTHLILGNSGCTSEAAQHEIDKAVEIANNHGINPETYIFPRNKIGHLDALRNSGLKFYRGTDSYWYENIPFSTIQKPMRFLDEALKRAPPVVSPRQVNGLIELPGSQILRPYHGPWKYTSPKSQFVRAKKGLSEAARTGKIFHLWFHPFNLGLNKDRHLNLLAAILEYAAQLHADGKIEFCTLSTAAKRGANK